MAEPDAPLSRNETIKRESRLLRGGIEEGLARKVTGAIEEDDTQLLKFHGTYQQDDRDLRPERGKRKLEKAFSFMVRVRIPGGVLTPAQFLALDAIARDYGSGTLRLTSRQSVQLHGVLKSNLRTVIAAIAAAGLDTRATCGDVNRTVMCTTAPLPARLHEEVLAIATAISEHLLPQSSAYQEMWLGTEGGADGDEEPIYGPDLPAAEIQDRAGRSAGERCRRPVPGFGLHRRVERGALAGLHRDRRGRDGSDARRAGDLSAPRRAVRLLHAGAGRRRRGGGAAHPARLRQPRGPQACAAEIHDRRPRARLVPERGRGAARREARAAAPLRAHPYRRPLRVERRSSARSPCWCRAGGWWRATRRR